MGMIIKAHDFMQNKTNGLFKPVIYCCVYADIQKDAKSINVILAEKLIKYGDNRRTMQLGKCFEQLLFGFPDETIIKEFDVMFNPAYKVDVLKLMLLAYKKKPFSVIWPGRYENERLFYAEEGYQDYKVFNINDYDITCVVQEE